MVTEFTIESIRESLKEVMDPEIPVLSLVDLGVVGKISITQDKIEVEMRPTFVGCPATNQMKIDIEAKLYALGAKAVNVDISFKSPWSSDMISEEGREALKKYGYAPPAKGGLVDDIDILEHVECPTCGKSNTELKSAFGPTLCCAIHYCHNCQEAFQSFKPI